MKRLANDVDDRQAAGAVLQSDTMRFWLQHGVGPMHPNAERLRRVGLRSQESRKQGIAGNEPEFRAENAESAERLGRAGMKDR